MIKYLVVIISILFLYNPSNAQNFGMYPPGIHVLKNFEISGHIMAIADVDGDDSCRYLFLVNVSYDFIPISKVCGDGEFSRFMGDEELKSLMDQDSDERKHKHEEDSSKFHRESEQKN